MYETFFGLREPPFELSANPRYLLLTPGHTEALCHIRIGLAAQGGLTLLLGGPGTGKTTLLRHALADESVKTRTVALTTPPASAAEFLNQMATAACIEPTTSRLRVHMALAQRLVESPSGCALILDEAQALGDDVLEECRLLGNIETRAGARLGIVLVSQPELGARLRQGHLESLRQRVGGRCVLQPLTLQEAGAYVAARMRVAGADATPHFTAGAIRAIHGSSGGIPRTINVICHNALLAAFGATRSRVEFETVAEVCRALDLPAPVRREPVTNFTTLAEAPAVARSRFRFTLRLPRRSVEQAVR